MRLADGGLARFEALATRLPELLEQLRRSRPIGEGSGGAPDRPGVYVLSEASIPMYVGQTRRLRRRLRQHGGRTSRQNQAVFAFAIARRQAANSGIAVVGVTREASPSPEWIRTMPRLGREHRPDRNLRAERDAMRGRGASGRRSRRQLRAAR